jgi:NOL1/NOP2/fmu family ribosome biogenesis protein
MGSITKSLQILNSRERKAILDRIEAQWGCRWESDFAFLRSDKDKIYIIDHDVDKIEPKKLRIDSVGLYVAQLPNDNEVRLTIEGAQIIGPLAKRNIVELSEAEARDWLRGEDIPVDPEGLSGFVILRQGDDFLGSGKVKESKVLNFVSKARRVQSTD